MAESPKFLKEQFDHCGLIHTYIHTKTFIERYSREIESEALDDSEPY